MRLSRLLTLVVMAGALVAAPLWAHPADSSWNRPAPEAADRMR